MGIELELRRVWQSHEPDRAKGSGPASSLNINPANNQITSTGYGYDNNGNATQTPGQTLVYDIENRLIESSGSFGTERYGYDPRNQRVLKKKPDGSEEFYLYGGAGELVETFKIVVWAPWTAPASTQTRVYFNGRLVRFVDPQARSERVIFEDRVGSMRLKAGFDNGSFSADQPRNYPYGENRLPVGTERFATYFRDSSTGLDYALNRYYGNSMGRFLTPDPSMGSARLGSPSTWNRYSYVSNDPVNKNDPSGLFDPGYFGPSPLDLMLWGYWLTPTIAWGIWDNPAFANAGVPPVPPGIQLAQRQLSTISKGEFKSKEKCREFFGKLIEQNNLDISVDSLMSQLQDAASKAIPYVYDGPSSTTTLDADKFPGHASENLKTVGDYFAAPPYQEALSQVNGGAIWIRSADWTGWFGSPYDGAYGLGTLMHELFHKKMVGGGFSGHQSMENALGGINALETAPYKNSISHSLGKICF